MPTFMHSRCSCRPSSRSVVPSPSTVARVHKKARNFDTFGPHMEQRNYGAIGKYASSAIRKTYTLGCDSERVRKCRRGNCRGYCENGAESIESSEAPAEAFWRSACSVGLLTAHNLPRQLRLVEPEPTSPPSRPAEAGAAYPGLKTVLGSAIRLLRRLRRRTSSAAACTCEPPARPAPSAPPGQGASATGAGAAPTQAS